jgi:glycosyltransferase involved in cell wall biosynthesis
VGEPHLSVVMPSYNAERTMASAIGSALSQTLRELEVIVVDDSEEPPTAVLERIGDDRVRLVAGDGRGPAAARNLGISLARGKYVAFLDADDLWLPLYAERMTGALDRSDDPGLAYTDAYWFQSETGRVRKATYMDLARHPDPAPSDPQAFLFALLERNFVYVSAMLPRSVLEEVGGYDESQLGAEDYELWLRVATAGHDPVWVPGCHALYRVHSGNRSQDKGLGARGLRDMYRGLSEESMPTLAHRELLARRRRETERELDAITGRLRVQWAIRRLRHHFLAIRPHLGLGEAWYDEPPPEVAAAFPDLSAV